jgi:hypothetical protein
MYIEGFILKTLVFILYGLYFATIALGDDLNLPSNLELVSRDSNSITLRYKDAGETKRLLLEGEPVSHVWHDNRITANDFYPTDDTCFSFKVVGHARPMSYDISGDANQNGRREIVGVYGGRTWIVEYSGHDTIYELVDSIYDAMPLNYSNDSDNDGLLEYLSRGIFSGRTIIFESPDAFTLPVDSAYSWDFRALGYSGVADIDGDGQLEIYLKRSHNLIEVWRSTSDNQYRHFYNISLPDTFGANFTDLTFGDFDGDGKLDIINTSDIGILLDYEYAAMDSFNLVWEGQVSHYNANVIIGPTDMDGDGHKEFIVMANSIANGGFYYYFFESISDNQFQQVAVDSLPGDAWEDGGMGLWDFDHDGRDELAVCYVDGIGLYKSFGDNSISLIYQQPGLLGISLIIDDINQNGWGDLILDAGTNWGTVIRGYIPGRNIFADVNCDCQISLLDLTYLVNYFKGLNPILSSLNMADVNGSCSVNGLDVTYFVNFFHGGPGPLENDCR